MAAQLVPPLFVPTPGTLIVAGVVVVGVSLFKLFGGFELIGAALQSSVTWLLQRADFVARWIYERAVSAWASVTGGLRRLWAGIATFASDVWEAVRVITLVHIPAAIRWAEQRVGALWDALNGWVADLAGRIADALTAALRAVDDLRRWVVAVPVAGLWGAVRSLTALVVDDVIPSIGNGLADVWRRARGLVSDLRLDLAFLFALGAGVVTTAVRTVWRCGEFLRWLCSRPKDMLHALMTGNWPILSLPIAIAAIRALATSSDAVEDELSNYIG